MKARFVLYLLLITVSAAAQQTDSLLRAYDERITQMEKTLQSQQQYIGVLQRNLKEQSATIALRMDSLESMQVDEAIVRSTTDENLQTQILESAQVSNSNIQETASHLVLAIIIGSFLMLIIVALVVVLYYMTHHREQRSIQKVMEAQQALQEEGAKLDAELIELLDKQFIALQAAPQKAEPDHSLALKIADEIVRIETNLSRMDTSVKGYKQLSASVRRIKDNFLANGYELVDMLGKPYKEGMKCVANFIPNEELEEGAKIITGITKPQINYNGVMIQAAEIIVSIN